MSIVRPLRWVKFSGIGFLLLVATAKGRPVFSLLAALAQSPWAEFPQPLAFPLVAAAACLLGWGALLLDVAFDRRLPRVWIVGIVVLAVAPWSPAPSPADRGAAELQQVAHQVQRGARDALRESGAIPSLPALLLPEAPGPYRSRSLRRAPIRLRILPDEDGPIRAPLAGDAPGTVYLAVRSDGKVGWITWLVPTDGRVRAAREGDKVHVLAVTPTAASERNHLAGGWR